MTRANPRNANGQFRRKARARFVAAGAPCAICHGRLGPIDYAAPSDAQHPLSLVIDEIRPVSRWREFGYESPAAAAQDPENLAPAHRVCNSRKGAKTQKEFDAAPSCKRRIVLTDGDW